MTEPTQPKVPGIASLFGFVPTDLIQAFAGELRRHAKDVGTACSLPDCDALTLGARCLKCSRRLCMSHAFWQLSGTKVTAYCVYCVVELNADLFADEDDG